MCIRDSSGEYDLCEKVMSDTKGVRNFAGKVSIEEFLWIVENSYGVVCNDSFTLHVASAFQKPTATVFCATSPRFGFGPWQNPVARVVEKTGLWCKPCRAHGSRVCPTRSEACMRGVTAIEVLSVLKDCLKRGDALV